MNPVGNEPVAMGVTRKLTAVRNLRGIAVLLVLVVGCACAETPGIDISGIWRLDRDLSTANLARVKFDRVIVHESQNEIRFDYFDHLTPVGSESFIADNVERPRYQTRLERAWAKAHWDQHGLSIRTRSFLDAQGYQSYNTYDTWEISPDGRTLINRSSDGKELVFYRISR